ncbi:hypothetical protein GUJ93_ZPchr0002g25447 [Zizania palustris]|uniref:Glycosyltransferase n=1 Tax=Zizania palustris TaxID=103762 RepID=A0A8J5S2U6_ZIZPA|nr:hypothetical protein GUJ93_ZPchr0002g25447 [Zizania palustris]
MGSTAAHVAVVAFPFSSHAPKLLAVARGLSTVAPSVTVSFVSTADTLARLKGGANPANLRFVEMPSGAGEEEGDQAGTPMWRRLEMFLEAAEDGGLKKALETAGAAGVKVSCVVGDIFMSMAAEVGLPWVAVWTGGPTALLAHLIGKALREDIGDNAASRADEFLTSYPGFGIFRVRDLPFSGPPGSTDGGNMSRVMTLLFRRVVERVHRAATAVAVNAFPGLFPPDISAALDDALPNCHPIGPYYLLPGAGAVAADDRHGCLPWLNDRPAASVVYVSFGTVASLPPDELRELASGLEATGAPFLWSLREDSWPLLPPGFMDRAKANNSGLLVPWSPQGAVLKHPAVGAFVTHSGWGAVLEGMSGGVPMACRPSFGDQHMNARAIEHLWCFGKALGDGQPLTSAAVTETVASLLTGEEGARMRANARDLQTRMLRAFGPTGESTTNFHNFVDLVCTLV